MKRQVVRRLRIRWRRAIERRAPDWPVDGRTTRALVLAPHPDDETLGAGGLIARVVADGGSVAVALISDGEQGQRPELITQVELATTRRAEFVAACAALGVDRDYMTLLGIPDLEIGGHFTSVSEQLAQLAEDFEPNLLLAPSGHDPHPDHRAVSQIARSISRLFGIPLLEYPIWSWTRWPWLDRASEPSLRDAILELARAARPRGMVRVDSSAFRTQKAVALNHYRSQLVRPPNAPTWQTIDPWLVELLQSPIELFFPIESELT